jgi:hypothetical protein
MLPCSWKQSLGVDCPYCGAQRSFWEFVSGDFWSSFIHFPALLPLLIVVVLTCLHLFKRSWVNPKWIVRFFFVAALIILISWCNKLFYVL